MAGLSPATFTHFSGWIGNQAVNQCRRADGTKDRYADFRTYRILRVTALGAEWIPFSRVKPSLIAGRRD